MHSVHLRLQRQHAVDVGLAQRGAGLLAHPRPVLQRHRCRALRSSGGWGAVGSRLGPVVRLPALQEVYSGLFFWWWLTGGWVWGGQDKEVCGCVAFVFWGGVLG